MREMDECSDKRSCWGPDRHTQQMDDSYLGDQRVHTHARAPVTQSHNHTRQTNRPTPHQSHCTYSTHRRREGGGHARAHLHTHARTHNHLTEQIVAPVLPSCLLTLKFTWSLVSQGCARKGREKKGKGAGGDKGGKSISL